MKLRTLLASMFIVGVLLACHCALGAERAGGTELEKDLPYAAKPARQYEGESCFLGVSREDLERWVNNIKHPTPWLTMGGDLRIRQTYTDNMISLLNSVDDRRNFLRVRWRVNATVGPFFVDEAVEQPNGLRGYVRFTYEPRYLFQRQPTQHTPDWDEVVWDNLWVEWARPGGAPLTVKAGRQDMVYGRGFVILDGTPLDGSRTIYNDAIKATIHLDEWKSNLDLFYINNNANQSRLHPINDQDLMISEYDLTMFGAYLTNRQLEGHELHAYYLYKDEDFRGSALPTPPTGRIVHTVGGLAQGKFAGNWDYYGEAAYQWGKESTADREGYGLSADLGYTWADCKGTPRVHAGYEYLSGDDPSTSDFEAWDPVLARWPHWSELYVYRWAFENFLPGNYTNLQRYTLGASYHPSDKGCLFLDYHLLLGNENTMGKTFAPPFSPYDDGGTRGQLVVAKYTHTFNQYMSGHLWAEYFHPESFYDDETDDAVFLRWQVMFQF